LPARGQATFTFCWAKDNRWEGTDYSVTIETN
jgi:hypothetical protein